MFTGLNILCCIKDILWFERNWKHTEMQSRHQDTRPGGACMILGGAPGGGCYSSI